jgi:RecA/RadA recombinase
MNDAQVADIANSLRNILAQLQQIATAMNTLVSIIGQTQS